MTPHNHRKDNNTPSIGLFVLILLIILILLFYKRSPEKEKELTEKLNEKRKALEEILSNIDNAKEFQARLLKDKARTTTILRWVVFGIIAGFNILLFLIIGYRWQVKDVLECMTISNATLFSLVYLYFFLRFGKFVEIKNVYSELQSFILKLRYDKTEEAIEAYLTHNLESREIIVKEIAEIEVQLKQIREGGSE